jgi:hypothetical protein
MERTALDSLDQKEPWASEGIAAVADDVIPFGDKDDAIPFGDDADDGHQRDPMPEDDSVYEDARWMPDPFWEVLVSEKWGVLQVGRRHYPFTEFRVSHPGDGLPAPPQAWVVDKTEELKYRAGKCPSGLDIVFASCWAGQLAEDFPLDQVTADTWEGIVSAAFDNRPKWNGEAQYTVKAINGEIRHVYKELIIDGKECYLTEVGSLNRHGKLFFLMETLGGEEPQVREPPSAVWTKSKTDELRSKLAASKTTSQILRIGDWVAEAQYGFGIDDETAKSWQDMVAHAYAGLAAKRPAPEPASASAIQSIA